MAKYSTLITSSNWWLRVWLRHSFTSKDQGQKGLGISIHGSYQVYLNGYFVGENGKWGKNKNEEQEGSRVNYFLIPDSIFKDSSNLISLRISSFYDQGKKFYPAIVFGNYFNLLRGELWYIIPVHILAGIFLVIAIYYFFLYFISHRYLPYLLFGILCFCFFSMLMLEYLRTYYLYPYSFHFKRLMSIASFAYVIGNILSLFLFFRFEIKRKYMLTLLLNTFLLPVIFLIDVYDDKIKAISIIGFTFALFICLLAIVKKRKGSQEAFYGVFACLLCHLNYDLMVYVGFALFVLFMLISLSKQMREQMQMQHETLLRSKRLEIELLKKNIQPHFLMNSLTSLMEWVERSPQSSIDFISALAAEFEILNNISSEKLIPITQELKLCQSHLAIMSYRKDIHYELKTINVDEAEMIPPAVLLTLIENGISHNIDQSTQAAFSISYLKEKTERVYKIFAPGETGGEDKEIKKGTGLKYIEARLEESYTGKWKLNSFAVNGGWKTEIIITH